MIALKGKADRVDLLEDGTFRLIDYKLVGRRACPGAAIAVYSLCAEQRLRPSGQDWTMARLRTGIQGPGASSVVHGDDREKVLGRHARVSSTRWTPSPRRVSRPQTHMCETCSYAAVCRTDYVDDV